MGGEGREETPPYFPFQSSVCILSVIWLLFEMNRGSTCWGGHLLHLFFLNGSHVKERRCTFCSGKCRERKALGSQLLLSALLGAS